MFPLFSIRMSPGVGRLVFLPTGAPAFLGTFKEPCFTNKHTICHRSMHSLSANLSHWPLEILGLVLEYYSNNVASLPELIDIRRTSINFDRALLWCTKFASQLRVVIPHRVDASPIFDLQIGTTNLGIKKSLYFLQQTDLACLRSNGLQFWITQDRLTEVRITERDQRASLPPISESVIFSALNELLILLKEKSEIQTFQRLTISCPLRLGYPFSANVIQKINESPMDFSASVILYLLDDSPSRQEERVQLSPKINEASFCFSSPLDSLLRWVRLDDQKTKIENLGVVKSEVRVSDLYRMTSLLQPHLKKLVVESTKLFWDNNGDDWSELVPSWLQDLELNRCIANGVEDKVISCPIGNLQVSTEMEKFGNPSDKLYWDGLDLGNLNYLTKITFPKLKRLRIKLFDVSFTEKISHMLPTIEHLTLVFTDWRQLDLLNSEVLKRSNLNYLELIFQDGEIFVPSNIIDAILELPNLSSFNLRFCVSRGWPRFDKNGRSNLENAIISAPYSNRVVDFTENDDFGVSVTIK